jgi:zinc/manganese transport system substrate-binding protein
VGWLPVLQSGSRNPRIQTGGDGYLDASTFVPVMEAPAGPVSRAQGDIHPGGNPHYLQEPRNGAKVARGIADRLARIDPSHAAGYAQRAADLTRDADALATRYAARFAALDPEKRKVVVYHRSWIYTEAWLGLTEVGAVEPKPGIPPDPAHVARLLALMRAQGVKAILAESYYPDTTTRLLADKTGAALVVVPGGTGERERYLDHLRDVADKILAALSR